MDEIFERIRAERRAQDVRWGSQRQHSPERWLAILVEEIGEAAEAILEHYPAVLEDELIQVAAVAVCWLEAMTS